MKRLIFLFSLFTFHFSLLTLFAQPVTQEWVRHYISGGTYNIVTGMAMDSSGNIIITGHITTTNQGQNFCTVKYSSTGVQQWVAIYNGPSANSTDAAVDVGVDTQGNVYVTGISERAGLGSDDYCTIKYSSQGVQQWVRRYGPYQGVNDPYALAIDNTGNVYVTGESTGIGTGQDYATIKYSPDGDSLWVRRYSSAGIYNDFATTIDIDEQANVYVGGFSQTLFKVTIIKYNTSGSQLWVNANITGGGTYSKLKLDYQNNIFYAGIINVGIDYNYNIIKYDSNGVFKWQQTYNGPGNSYDIPYDLATDYSGNVYVTGRSFGSITGSDYATLKYNSFGVQQWERRYDENLEYDEAHGIALDDSANVYITGRTTTGPPPNGYDQFTTIKYSSSGEQRWIMNYAGGGAACILVDNYRNVYVSGGDFVTIKYSQLVGLQNTGQQIPNSNILFNNYPNPFNPETNIKYLLSKRTKVNLSVFDVLGRKVAELVNAEQNEGEYNINFIAINLSSGLYLFRLQTEDFSDSKIMILQK